MHNVKVYIRGWLGYFGIAKYEKHDGRLGRLATPPIPDVHLETMEEPQNAC